jgi:hypothetical protein
MFLKILLSEHVIIEGVKPVGILGILSWGVNPLIHQSELRTYTLKEKSSFRFVILWKLLNGME